MDTERINLLNDHYKDTFHLLKRAENSRNRVFFYLFIAAILLYIQIVEPDNVTGTITTALSAWLGIKLLFSPSVIQTGFWFILFGIALRYFQINSHIERQYTYLHQIEDQLNILYPNTGVFTREGKFYLKKYPYFLNWTWFVYTIFFPVFLIFLVSVKIYIEWKNVAYSTLSLVINSGSSGS